MKKSRLFFYSSFSVLLILLTITLDSCKIGRFVYYNFADITDHKIFPSRPLTAAGKPFYFIPADSVLHPKGITAQGKSYTFGEFLEKNATVAFLIIRGDTLLYERYFNQYTDSSVVASFSMAKSVTSILIGMAIEDGLIRSVEDPVSLYLPELAHYGFDRVTLHDVLQMTSGLDFNESYVNPMGDAATFYYGTNLHKAVNNLRLKQEPGKHWEYTSGNTQILGMVLEKALKGKTITAYLQEKLWTPLGMEYPASWSLDRKNGVEKTFCCLNARARDFAKIGRLYLNKGNWNGQQLVSQAWVTQSTKVDNTRGSVSHYQYQWWLPFGDKAFMAQGILGQYIYVRPDKQLIFVRLGKAESDISWSSFFNDLSEAY